MSNRPMSQEQLSLLQEIIENPKDDAIRLVYADYLEETSNLASERARAEFIRLQIKSHPQIDLDAEIIRLEYRKLWRSNLWPLSLCKESSLGTARESIETFYERGFICRIGLDHNTFLMEKLAGVLFSFEPIREVKLVDRITTIHNRRHIYLPITEDNKYALFNYNIDPRIFNLFEAKIHLTYGGNRYETKGEFDSLEEANKALSNACVMYGKDEAEKYLNERMNLANTR